MSFQLVKKIKNLLKENYVEHENVESDKILGIQKKILKNKKLTKKVFSNYYFKCMKINETWFLGEGDVIELGSGTSFIKDYFPDVITSDTRQHNSIDLVLDSQKMNLEEKSVRAFIGINCFHHFSNPRLFFKELDRVLISNGGCILIEPYHGTLAKFLFNHLHDTEYFDINQTDWEQDSKNMANANQALSYIIFKRDLNIFKNENPNLDLIFSERINDTFSHIMSGGLNYKQLVPGPLIIIPKILDHLSKPFSKWLSLHQIIVLKKKN
jgi:hypothetical protein